LGVGSFSSINVYESYGFAGANPYAGTAVDASLKVKLVTPPESVEEDEALVRIGDCLRVP
jgi:hypothetical protein